MLNAPPALLRRALAITVLDNTPLGTALLLPGAVADADPPFLPAGNVSFAALAGGAALAPGLIALAAGGGALVLGASAAAAMDAGVLPAQLNVSVADGLGTKPACSAALLLTVELARAVSAAAFACPAG